MNYETDREIRADRFVADALKIGRNEAARIIRESNVWLGGKRVAKPSAILPAGAPVKIDLPAKADNFSRGEITADDLDILYEDSAILILNKPAGLITHPAPGHKGDSLSERLRAKGFSLSNLLGEERAGVVHRLDKGTTGAIAIAKTNEAAASLAKQLKTREMGRFYLAIIDRPLKEDAIVDKPIGRNRANRVKMAVVSGAREAKSAFAKLAELKNGEELIAAKLFTGRTHQIRVHLQSIGTHIVGDTVYGYRGSSAGHKTAKDKIAPIFLHAHRLYLTHPIDARPLSVAAPLPKPFLERLEITLKGGQIEELLRESHINDRVNSIRGLRQSG